MAQSRSNCIRILFGMRDDGQMTEPMNLMLLSALAQKHFNAEVDLWVMERDDLNETIKKFHPDLVAFSGITGSHKYYIEAAYRIKKIDKNIKIIVGGPHFTFFPGEILQHDCIDALCVGEGDDAWVEWLETLVNNGNTNEIRNIVTRENMSRVLTKDCRLNPTFMRGRKTNLDDLPFMDRGLIYDNTEFRYRYKRTIMASRGCPFRCTYCFEHQWNEMYSGIENAGAIRRLFSVDRLLSELEEVVSRYDTRYIKFYDDVFPPFPSQKEREWHKEFCEEYPKRIGLPFHILTRCNLVVDLLENYGLDVLMDWKKAGLVSISMSIESGNQFIRDNVILRDMTKADIEKAFAHAWKIGLSTSPDTILGIPAPILPKINDVDFDAKLEEIDRQCKILREINGRTINLDAVLETASEWFIDPYEKRGYILDSLKSAGLRESFKDYDKESIRFVLAQKPGFPEFPILAPYPKTKATEWTIAIGAFDGNFSKLHESYQGVSYLDCYDPGYKKVMHNFALLGSFCALFSGSRNFIMQWLDPLVQKICLDYLAEITHPKATRFYGWLYVIFKHYMHTGRTYKMKTSFRERFRFFRKLVELDFFKQFKKPLRRSERPGQTLGTPPSI